MFFIDRHGRRHWAVRERDDETKTGQGNLIAITVYKRGAREVVKRLNELTALASNTRWAAV